MTLSSNLLSHPFLWSPYLCKWDYFYYSRNSFIPLSSFSSSAPSLSLPSKPHPSLHIPTIPFPLPHLRHSFSPRSLTDPDFLGIRISDTHQHATPDFHPCWLSSVCLVLKFIFLGGLFNNTLCLLLCNIHHEHRIIAPKSWKYILFLFQNIF